jgi:alanine-alpha-ketoisovalerate/valine-pyruvate aminotransferase
MVLIHGGIFTCLDSHVALLLGKSVQTFRRKMLYHFQDINEKSSVLLTNGGSSFFFVSSLVITKLDDGTSKMSVILLN